MMITGDHPLTAQRIAAEIGIQADGQVISGTQLDSLSKSDLKLLAESTSVYARVSPDISSRSLKACNTAVTSSL